MDLKLWSSFVWAFGLMVLLGLTAMAIAYVRRRIGPGADESTPSPGGSLDWISLLNNLQDGRIEPKRWIALAPLLVTHSSSCPPALRAPIIAALDLAMSHGRDPLARMSMNQIRTALAALPGA